MAPKAQVQVRTYKPNQIFLLFAFHDRYPIALILPQFLNARVTNYNK
jgi:hypothetical protein